MNEIAKKEPSLTDLEKEMLKLPQVEMPVTHNLPKGFMLESCSYLKILGLWVKDTAMRLVTFC